MGGSYSLKAAAGPAVGAVEVVAKPQLGLRDFLRESSMRLVDTIRAAAGARVKRRLRPVAEPRLTADAMLVPAKPPVRTGRPAETIVAIGASTGGTEALRELLHVMPADAPGMVIVQHVPEEFTAAFAERLNGVCSMEVKEAADGDPVQGDERSWPLAIATRCSCETASVSGSRFLTVPSSAGIDPVWMSCSVPWRRARALPH